MAGNTESGDNLRVALLGYGLAGAVFHAPLIKTTGGLEVSAIVTANPERQKQAATDFPQAKLVDKAAAIFADASSYDAVVIATPNKFHYSLGVAAMEAGLAAVIDKPVSVDVGQCEDLIDVSKRTNKVLSVFQNRRFDNDFLTLQKLIAGGSLGKITRFESRFERYRPQPRPGSWREMGSSDEGGGILFDLGSHLIDQALVLFGKPLQVYAEMHRRRAGVEVDDDSFVALTFPGDVRAHLYMSALAPHAGLRFRVSGVLGAFEKYGLDPQEDALRAGSTPLDGNFGCEAKSASGKLITFDNGQRRETTIESERGCYGQFYEQFRDAVLGRADNPVPAEQALETMKVIAAANKSAVIRDVVCTSME